MDQRIVCPHCGKSFALDQAAAEPIKAGIRQELEKRFAEERAALEKSLRQGAELRLQKSLDEERRKITEEAGRRAAEDHRLKDREKDKQLADMRAQIEDLRRKAEQGSQQTQGEVLELELEQMLRSHFPADSIEPVAKGVRGADLVQRVASPSGKPCGTILWESKRTKAWSDGWIEKLKDDLRDAKADLGIIVSTALPKDAKRIDLVEGIWVCDFQSCLGLATALRVHLIQLAQARAALTGKGEKMELLYQYLSGPQFRQRIEAIVESFQAMKEDLDAEKRAMDKIWSKREKQIQRVLHGTAGMYGDLQGLGAALPQNKLLELPSDGD